MYKMSIQCFLKNKYTKDTSLCTFSVFVNFFCWFFSTFNSARYAKKSEDCDLRYIREHLVHSMKTFANLLIVNGKAAILS